MKLPLLITFVAVACNPPHYERPKDLDKRIAQSVRNGEGSVLHLADLTDFSWDYVVILGPYTPKEEAEKLVGVPWPEYEKTGLHTSDAMNLLAFTLGNRIVHVEEVSRRSGDFAQYCAGEKFTPETAIFVVKYERSWPMFAPKARSN